MACLNSLDSIIGRAAAAGRYGWDHGDVRTRWETRVSIQTLLTYPTHIYTYTHENRPEQQQQDDASNDDALVQELQRLKDDLVAYSSTAATAAAATAAGATALRAAAIASSGGNGNPLPVLPSSPPGSSSSEAPPSLATLALASAVGGGKTLMSLGGGGGSSGAEEDNNPLHSQIRDLRTRLEQKEVTEYLIHADRNFLQQLVMEREAMLAEITAVVEEVDERQRWVVDGYNAR